MNRAKKLSSATSSMHQYDVFISYSHENSGDLPQAIQRGLEKFARPWYKRWALRVFRDTSGLSVNEALWPRIADAIHNSRNFILLASPQAAISPWVQKEVKERINMGGNILLVLIDGQIQWDSKNKTFDWSITNSLPRNLSEHFNDEPLYLDLRWVDAPTKRSLNYPGFRDSIAALVATIRGIDKDELHSEAVKIHRRAMQVAWSAVVILFILLSLAIFFGISASKARDDALKALVRSEARRLEIEATAAPAKKPQRKLLLAIQSIRELEKEGISPTQGSLQAIHDNMIGGHPLVGHTGGITGIEISPDGKHVLSLSNDETARVWTLESGKSIVLHGHTARLNVGSFSPDGKRIITGSSDGTARIWNADGTGDPIVLKPHRGEVKGVSFSHEGEFIATVTDDSGFSSSNSYVEMWQINGAIKSRLLAKVDRGPQSFVEFDPDDKHLLVPGPTPNSVQIISIDGIDNPYVMYHNIGIRYATFSHSGKYVATGSVDGNAYVWPLPHGSPLVLHGHNGTVYRVHFDQNDKYLITASFDGTARTWSLNNLQNFVSYQGHENFLYDARFSPDGNRVLTASLDQTARLWRRDGEGQPLVLLGHEDRVEFARFTPDGNTIITASDGDNIIRVWNAWAIGEPRILWWHTGTIFKAEISPDGSRVLTVSADGTAIIWNLRTTDHPIVLWGHTDHVMDGAFSPDGKYVVTGSTDGTTRLWQTAEGRFMHILAYHTGQVDQICFNSLGTHVVSSSWDDGFPILCNILTRKNIELRIASIAKVYDLSFSPDGQELASGWTDGIVRFWDLNGHLLRELSIGIGNSASDPGMSIRMKIQYSSSGTKLLISADDMYKGGPIVQIWSIESNSLLSNLYSGSKVVFTTRWNHSETEVAIALIDKLFIRSLDSGTSKVLRGHEGVVNDMQFSPDDTKLATASEDGTIRIWDLSSDAYPIILKGHSAAVRSVRFTPDGKSVVTASDDGTGRVWTLDANLLIAKACAVVGRNFTLEEWQQYFGNRPLEKTCTEWSLMNTTSKPK